jgi:hypothetical protein
VDTRIKSAQDDFRSIPPNPKPVIVAAIISPDTTAARGERVGVRGGVGLLHHAIGRDATGDLLSFLDGGGHRVYIYDRII